MPCKRLRNFSQFLAIPIKFSTRRICYTQEKVSKPLTKPGPPLAFTQKVFVLLEHIPCPFICILSNGVLFLELSSCNRQHRPEKPEIIYSPDNWSVSTSIFKECFISIIDMAKNPSQGLELEHGR